MLQVIHAIVSGVDFDVRLTADVADVRVEYGLVVPHANTIVPSAYKPPPGNYTAGTMVVAMLRSLETVGAYEVYVTNSTGNIPRPFEKKNGPGMCVYRWTTTDFHSYQGGDCALWLPSDGLGDVKTMTRDDSTGKYYMLWWGPGAPGANGGSPYLFYSTDDGKSWAGPHLTTGLDHYNPPGTDIHAKDDINLVYQPGVGLIDLQLFWQKNAPIPGGYCDNGGCAKRRVLGTMTGSADGLIWNFTNTTRMPGEDENDPPELQFYRSRPFLVPGTRGTRIFAHTLLYAPSPYINLQYGRQPPEGGGSCNYTGGGPVPNATLCHGPHMYEEWWTLAAGGSAADITAGSWRRPARFTKMAPLNAYLFAQPGLVGQGESMKMVWVGSGEVYTLPMHRGVGLYAPANARVKVPAFDLSHATGATRLFINADAAWGPPLSQGGCDETCAAYVLVELEDAEENIIDGFDRGNFTPIMAQDGINLPLQWRNSTRLPIGHGNVTVKIWFRAAKVYAVYLGDSFDPAF